MIKMRMIMSTEMKRMKMMI